MIVDPFNEFPVLTLPNGFKLREFRHSDATSYFKLLKHPQVCLYIPDSFMPKTRIDAVKEMMLQQSLFNQRKTIFWVIANDKDELIGSCGYENWHKQQYRVEISYELHPDYWGQGIATEALRSIIDFGFKYFLARRFEAYTLPNNTQSNKLLERLNFKLDGTLRQYRCFNGQQTDVLIFSLLPDDWNNE
ncbi:MAG TPA: GNAT family protein [Gammaproteobacteria bacterium]|nr:GNAT family protein [Gammaproteobacteria bacterium]